MINDLFEFWLVLKVVDSTESWSKLTLVGYTWEGPQLLLAKVKDASGRTGIFRRVHSPCSFPRPGFWLLPDFCLVSACLCRIKTLPNWLWMFRQVIGPWSLWWSQKSPPKPHSPLWISKKKSMSYLIHVPFTMLMMTHPKHSSKTGEKLSTLEKYGLNVWELDIWT